MDELTFIIIYVIGIFVAVGLDFLCSYLYNRNSMNYRYITVGDIMEGMQCSIVYIFSWITAFCSLCAILITSTEYLKKYIKRKIGNKVIFKK